MNAYVMSYGFYNSDFGLYAVVGNEQGVLRGYFVASDNHDDLVQDCLKIWPHYTFTYNQIWANNYGAAIFDQKKVASVPIIMSGTPFQELVWKKLRSIPVGTVVSYGDVARTLGKPTAFRAVARAAALNKVAVAIPCHRVLKAGRELCGYRWGIERKAALLRAEGVCL